MISIYCLKDPDTGQVCYVGRTSQSVDRRFIAHVSESQRANNRRCQWIKKILNQGKMPVIEVIDQCQPSEQQKKKQYWIEYYRSINPNLTNNTEEERRAPRIRHWPPMPRRPRELLTLEEKGDAT